MEPWDNDDPPSIKKATILSIGCLAKAANIHATWVDSSLPRLTEAVITKALAPQIEAEKKQIELIEAQTLRMDRLEVTLEDGKEVTGLKKRVTVEDKRYGGSEGTSIMKSDIDTFNKEMASLMSTNLSSFLDGLEEPSKVDINATLNDVMDFDASGKRQYGSNVEGTPETNYGELGVTLARRSVKSWHGKRTNHRYGEKGISPKHFHDRHIQCM